MRLSNDQIGEALQEICHRSNHCICNACERVHFNEDESDWDEEDAGEVGGLRFRAQQDPDQYEVHDMQVFYFTFGEKTIVLDCPCEEWLRIGQALWGFRKEITRFFTAHVEISTRTLAEAQTDARRVREIVRRRREDS